jgi:uncharacterized protein YegL
MISINTQLLGALFASLGFQNIGKSTISSRLARISPNGETALRDSVKAGIGLIMKLNLTLDKLNCAGAWSFVHIVITDGVDTVSKTSPQELIGLFGLINTCIPTERCMTVFIGVDLNRDAVLELAALKIIGGDNCQLHSVNHVNLQDIFQRISASIRMQRQVNIGVASIGRLSAMRIQTANRTVFNIQRRNFAVLLNLDISGSMNGSRFVSLKNSVDMFLRNLDSNDIASCLVFNSKVELLR